MNNLKTVRMLLAFGVIVLITVDQLVKEWARATLMPPDGLISFPVIEGFFGFRWAINTGAAFGIFPGGRWIFVGLTIVIIVVVLLYESTLPHTKQNLWQRVIIMLILAGGIGNFIDRLLFGYVVDMFEFLFISFPIFNVADILVVVGVFGYVFYEIISTILAKKQEKAAELGTSETIGTIETTKTAEKAK
ncbi:MAG: signal peptidase II [Defluviitaleaceae bacterium]|nr:signal peptidase II [Defluviitaleaceae bacterium]